MTKILHQMRVPLQEKSKNDASFFACFFARNDSKEKVTLGITLPQIKMLPNDFP